MPNTAALWYFESVNLFQILCPHKVKKMGEVHEYINYKRNQFIYMPDESATHIYMVVTGKVKIGHYLEDGEEVLSAILTTGEFLAIWQWQGRRRKILLRQWRRLYLSAHDN